MHPSLHINYKNFDLKQYFKEGRGCRTEGTFRNPNDFGVSKGLANLPYLQKIGRQINRRLLEVERVTRDGDVHGQRCRSTVYTATGTGPHRCATRSADLPGVSALESRLKT
ncbi:hypothetical protein SBA3_1200001 [Candidatus Sulfopaludibacter sp. SbA3]|nr:hypothetical protein SBA3_1200001 [Candidatus Sulfopaludibacter sp. SbA3]